MKFYLLAFLLTLFLNIHVPAQAGGTLTGVINIGGKPAAGATVEINLETEPTKKTAATTDVAGVYKFENLAPGDYRIWAELREPSPRPGLSGAALGGAFGSVKIRSGKTETVDLTLTTAVYLSQHIVREFVTIAADSRQTIEQVSKSVDSIEAQEMRDRADFALVDSLRTIPGMRIQQLGGFGRTASIKTRGLRNQDTAVLIDGIRFRDPSSIAGDASAFISDLTLTSVSKVEILRGPGSSLYGTNAAGGTIDLQTPIPAAGWHGNISGAFGGDGLGRFRGNISKGLNSGKFGFNAGVSRTVYRDGIDGDDRSDNTNFQARIEANPFGKTNISARIFFSDAFVKLNSSPDTLGSLPASTSTVISARPGVNFLADVNDPDDRQRSKFFNGQIVLTQALGKGIVFQGYYSGLTTSRRNANGPLGSGFQPFGGDEEYRFKGRSDVFIGKIDWSAKGNTLSAGFEHEREGFDNDGVFVTGSNNFSLSSSQSSNTVFVQDLIGFMDGELQFSGAFRAQWFSLERPRFSSPNYPNRFDTVVSPPASYIGDGSVSYYFEKTRTKIRSHVGNGYRIPSLYERFGSYFFLGSFFGLGNPALKPERSISADLGVDQDVWTNRLRFSATYFYNEIRDEIAYLPTDDFGAPAYFNADRHFSRGLEISTRIMPAKTTDITASYTFVNSDTRGFRRLTAMPPATLAGTDRRSFGVPAHQFTIVATQRFKGLWVNFDFLATSDYLAPIFSNTTFSTYTYRFSGNRRADLTAGYTIKRRQDKWNVRIFGTVENLFDNEYFENGFRTPGRNARLGVSFGF